MRKVRRCKQCGGVKQFSSDFFRAVLRQECKGFLQVVGHVKALTTAQVSDRKRRCGWGQSDGEEIAPYRRAL